MTINEIKIVLEHPPADNVICCELEFRPKHLSLYFAAIANRAEEFGYVIIGAKKTEDTYLINGISSDIEVGNPINSALEKLTDLIKIEYGKYSIKNKTVLAIKIYRLVQPVFAIYDSSRLDKDTQFISDLILACIKLQAAKIYFNASEDERNDYIRDILETAGYTTKDQTRRSKSAMGKSAGELDIYIEEKGFPFTLIEALNLSSVDKSYISKHLDKIFTYDTAGTPFNVCLTYADVKHFEKFWDNYREYVITYEYPCKLISYDKDADKQLPFSEIRYMTTQHMRSGKFVTLYHICVKFLD